MRQHKKDTLIGMSKEYAVSSSNHSNLANDNVHLCSDNLDQ